MQAAQQLAFGHLQPQPTLVHQVLLKCPEAGENFSPWPHQIAIVAEKPCCTSNWFEKILSPAYILMPSDAVEGRSFWVPLREALFSFSHFGNISMKNCDGRENSSSMLRKMSKLRR